MKFGFLLPAMHSHRGSQAPWERTATMADRVRIARKADDLGYDWLGFADHLVIPDEWVPVYGDAWMEALTSMAYLAAVTRRIRLTTFVLVLPYRDPILTAKMVATLDFLSQGRVTLGVGVGHMAREFQALRVPFAERGALMDEALQVLVELWTKDSPEFEGRYYRFHGITFAPKPVQKPYPPLWIGGNARAALRRAATYGDGWVPNRMPAEELRQRLAYLRAQPAFRARGRPFDICLPLAPSEVALPDPRAVPEPWAPPATTEQFIDLIRALQEAGATGASVPMGITRSAEHYLERLQWFAEEIMPHFKDAAPAVETETAPEAVRIAANAGPGLASASHHFPDAVDAVEAYIERGWTDGLPVIPPTEERVTAFLEAAGLPPNWVIGESRPLRRVATAEKVAINAVMAGCRPEYMPVLVAALEALCTANYGLHGPATSVAGCAPLLIVSGPAASRLGFNSGANVLGPGARANATVGRAIRLVLINLFGVRPGGLDRSLFGHPGKFSYCIAESEDLGGWQPHHVERGLAPEESAVTALWAMAPQQVGWDFDRVPENLLTAIGRAIARAPSGGAPYSFGYWTVLFGGQFHAILDGAGWSKADVRQFLYEASHRTIADVKRAGLLPGAIARADEAADARPIPSPDHLIILKAGGDVGLTAAFIPPYAWEKGYLTVPVTRKIGPGST